MSVAVMREFRTELIGRTKRRQHLQIDNPGGDGVTRGRIDGLGIRAEIVRHQRHLLRPIDRRQYRLLIWRRLRVGCRVEAQVVP